MASAEENTFFKKKIYEDFLQLPLWSIDNVACFEIFPLDFISK